VARTELGESKWDWTGARAPTALTKKQAEKRENREKADNEKEEKARRQKELEKSKQQEVKNPGKGGGGHWPVLWLWDLVGEKRRKKD